MLIVLVIDSCSSRTDKITDAHSVVKQSTERLEQIDAVDKSSDLFPIYTSITRYQFPKIVGNGISAPTFFDMAGHQFYSFVDFNLIKKIGQVHISRQQYLTYYKGRPTEAMLSVENGKINVYNMSNGQQICSLNSPVPLILNSAEQILYADSSTIFLRKDSIGAWSSYPTATWRKVYAFDLKKNGFSEIVDFRQVYITDPFIKAHLLYAVNKISSNNYLCTKGSCSLSDPQTLEFDGLIFTANRDFSNVGAIANCSDCQVSQMDVNKNHTIYCLNSVGKYHPTIFKNDLVKNNESFISFDNNTQDLAMQFQGAMIANPSISFHCLGQYYGYYNFNNQSFYLTKNFINFEFLAVQKANERISLFYLENKNKYYLIRYTPNKVYINVIHNL